MYDRPLPPNLWDWLYHSAPREPNPELATCLRGINRDGFKLRYYQMAHGRVPDVVGLWIMQMIGKYKFRFQNGRIPAGYPIGHKFERVEDVRAAFLTKQKEPNMQSQTPPAPWQQAQPFKPNPAPVVLPSPVSVEAAQQLLDEAKAYVKAEEKAKREAEAEAARKLEEQRAAGERRERLHYDRRLAATTRAMLDEIHSIEYTGGRAQMVECFAEFRDALAPLAAAYGYKLVLVGDKTRAVLTK